MLYEFKCQEHGAFTVRQPIYLEHAARCPECGVTAQRVFSKPQWIWSGSVYRPDGTLRPDSDYAMLKGSQK